MSEKDVCCRYFVDAVKEVDIYSVVTALCLPVAKKGAYDFIPCPGHSNRTGKPDRNATNAKLCDNPKGYYCFACGEFVPMIDMVQETLDCSFNEAVNFIGDNCGVPPKHVGSYDYIRRSSLTNEERDLLELPHQAEMVRCLIGISTTEPLLKKGEISFKKDGYFYKYQQKKSCTLNRIYNDNKYFYNNFIKWRKLHRQKYYKNLLFNIESGKCNELLTELFDDETAKQKLCEIYKEKISQIKEIKEMS